MAATQPLSPEERQRRIEEARRKAEELKRQREVAAATGQGTAPPGESGRGAPSPSPPAAAGAAAPPPAPAPPALSPEERQRRIEEAKRRAEEARKAREAAAPAAAKPGPAAPPRPPKTLGLGLREWGVVVKALEEGKQLILFRKGGIGGRGFRVLRDEFILVPTAEGGDEAMLKPAFRPLLKGVAADPPGGRPRATSFARLFDVIPVKNLDKLAQLDEYHIFSKAYIDARHNSRVDLPTNVLFLRVYRLPQPAEVEVRADRDGWIEAVAQVALDGAQPALPEERFRALYQEIRTIIS